jgi:hypothetical protein
MFKPATDRQRAYLGLSWDQINTLQGYHRNQAMALWQWAAPRFSSFGTDQARYFDRYGAEATYKRINKVRRWLGLELI